MAKSKGFRVGRVTVYPRGQVWYLRYHEHGRRRQVRAATDKAAARQLAAQVNAQLETGAPAATSFEPVSLPELRRRWLDHHEHVLRSSVATINRYRTATDHLLAFVQDVRPIKQAAQFQVAHAEQFVRHLRQLKVAPNGHKNAAKRPLRDSGVKYILEVCRTLFNFAAKHRHLPPYADNPFTAIEIERIPIEDAKPFVDMTPEQERAFLEACDDWQFPIFLTLMLTGLRPGELTHLLLPEDLDLEAGWLHVRNKPDLGWQVKTRNERSIPLMPELVAVLRHAIGERQTGPAFVRRRFVGGDVQPPLAGMERRALVAEFNRRLMAECSEPEESLDRHAQRRLARYLWRDTGAIKPERVRTAFAQICRRIGLPELTAPKTLRHLFATALQDANVDPLIRNELMGHVPAGGGRTGNGLAMTATYTHTRPDTLRGQLVGAMRERVATKVADERTERGGQPRGS